MPEFCRHYEKSAKKKHSVRFQTPTGIEPDELKCQPRKDVTVVTSPNGTGPNWLDMQTHLMCFLCGARLSFTPSMGAATWASGPCLRRVSTMSKNTRETARHFIRSRKEDVSRPFVKEASCPKAHALLILCDSDAAGNQPLKP